jgi:hypothetical protein
MKPIIPKAPITNYTQNPGKGTIVFLLPQENMTPKTLVQRPQKPFVHGMKCDDKKILVSTGVDATRHHHGTYFNAR